MNLQMDFVGNKLVKKESSAVVDEELERVIKSIKNRNLQAIGFEV